MIYYDIADFRTRASHEVHHARRQTCFFQDLKELERDRG
jgi:hypothetical protein